LGRRSRWLRSADRYFAWLPGGVLAFVVGTYVLLVLVVYWYVVGRFPSAEALGQFGDYLSGTLNPFFSLVALVFIARTWLSQQRSSDQASALVRDSAMLARRTEVLHRVLDLLERLEQDFADAEQLGLQTTGERGHVRPSRRRASLVARRERLATHVLELASYVVNVPFDEKDSLLRAVRASLSTASRSCAVEQSVVFLSHDHRLTVSKFLDDVGGIR
jgi:uncharacterized membrane protein